MPSRVPQTQIKQRGALISNKEEIMTFWEFMQYRMGEVLISAAFFVVVFICVLAYSKVSGKSINEILIGKKRKK